MLKRFFVTTVILLVIGAVIFGCVKIFGNETKMISVTEFSVGGLDEFGEFERNDRALITKEMFECRGLTVEPDIESTSQAFNFLHSEGIVDRFDGFPTAMKDKAVKFIALCQDPEDGYFYHKGWGKNISTSRRTREFLEKNEKNGAVVPCDDLPKSFVLTAEYGMDRIYLTSLSSTTLEKRLK